MLCKPCSLPVFPTLFAAIPSSAPGSSQAEIQHDMCAVFCPCDHMTLPQFFWPHLRLCRRVYRSYRSDTHLYCICRRPLHAFCTDVRSVPFAPGGFSSPSQGPPTSLMHSMATVLDSPDVNSPAPGMAPPQLWFAYRCLVLTPYTSFVFIPAATYPQQQQPSVPFSSRNLFNTDRQSSNSSMSPQVIDTSAVSSAAASFSLHQLQTMLQPVLHMLASKNTSTPPATHAQQQVPHHPTPRTQPNGLTPINDPGMIARIQNQCKSEKDKILALCQALGDHCEFYTRKARTTPEDYQLESDSFLAFVNKGVLHTGCS